jgi:catechol-2,3-dioxygenase
VIMHVGINVPDLDGARTYYEAVMPALSFEPYLTEETQFAYLPAGGGTELFFYAASDDRPYSRAAAGLQHIGFTVPTRRAVEAVHHLVLDLGSPVVHPPQYFPQYMPHYYALFWEDPHGFMLEAACLGDRP